MPVNKKCVSQEAKINKFVKSFSEIFRSGWDVLIRSTANFIVPLTGMFVNRLVMLKETKNLSTKLTRLSSST